MVLNMMHNILKDTMAELGACKIRPQIDILDGEFNEDSL